MLYQNVSKNVSNITYLHASDCIKMFLKMYQTIWSCIKHYGAISNCIEQYQAVSECIEMYRIVSNCSKMYQIARHHLKSTSTRIRQLTLWLRTAEVCIWRYGKLS
jgi:hypothetical protein